MISPSFASELQHPNIYTSQQNTESDYDCDPSIQHHADDKQSGDSDKAFSSLNQWLGSETQVLRDIEALKVEHLVTFLKKQRDDESGVFKAAFDEQIAEFCALLTAQETSLTAVNHLLRLLPGEKSAAAVKMTYLTRCINFLKHANKFRDYNSEHHKAYLHNKTREVKKIIRQFFWMQKLLEKMDSDEPKLTAVTLSEMGLSDEVLRPECLSSADVPFALKLIEFVLTATLMKTEVKCLRVSGAILSHHTDMPEEGIELTEFKDKIYLNKVSWDKVFRDSENSVTLGLRLKSLFIESEAESDELFSLIIRAAVDARDNIKFPDKQQRALFIYIIFECIQNHDDAKSYLRMFIENLSDKSHIVLADLISLFVDDDLAALCFKKIYQIEPKKIKSDDTRLFRDKLVLKLPDEILKKVFCDGRRSDRLIGSHLNQDNSEVIAHLLKNKIITDSCKIYEHTDPFVTDNVSYHFHLLNFACKNGRVACVKVILENLNTLSNRKYDLRDFSVSCNTDTTIIQLAVSSGKVKLVKYLLYHLDYPFKGNIRLHGTFPGGILLKALTDEPMMRYLVSLPDFDSSLFAPDFVNTALSRASKPVLKYLLTVDAFCSIIHKKSSGINYNKQLTDNKQLVIKDKAELKSLVENTKNGSVPALLLVNQITLSKLNNRNINKLSLNQRKRLFKQACTERDTNKLILLVNSDLQPLGQQLTHPESFFIECLIDSDSAECWQTILSCELAKTLLYYPQVFDPYKSAFSKGAEQSFRVLIDQKSTTSVRADATAHCIQDSKQEIIKNYLKRAIEENKLGMLKVVFDYLDDTTLSEQYIACGMIPLRFLKTMKTPLEFAEGQKPVNKDIVKLIKQELATKAIDNEYVMVTYEASTAEGDSEVAAEKSNDNTGDDSENPAEVEKGQEPIETNRKLEVTGNKMDATL